MARLQWDFTLNVMDVALFILTCVSLGISISVMFHLKHIKGNQQDIVSALIRP
jgi:hypothetical protein